MASVNPNIALSARPFQLDLQQRNPLQEYAQISAIQNAQIQNQLARQQMEQEQGVMNYLRTADLNTPEGRAGLRGFGKAGFGYEKLLAEQETNALQRRELEGKLRAQQMAALGTGLTSVLADPSDANLNAAFDRLDATGVNTRPFRQQFANMPDLAARKTAITQYVTSNPEGRQALAFVQPKPEKMDLNGRIVVIDMNPNSATYQQEVKQLAKTTTPPAMVAEYTFAKTPEGGGFRGTYQEFVTARAAAGRAPQQPVAPTITQIVDPSNPNQMITIDARRYAGGGIGSPGVLGVGGKEPAAAVRENKAEAGKTQLADDLENLRASFRTLDQLRAIPSTERGALSNIAAATAATGPGQVAGRFFSTEAQVEREIINSARTRLVNSIKNATGMSAQQLNSNVELQTMLKSISDPGQPIQAALRIIDDIENAYVKGAGMPKKPSGQAPAAAPATTPAPPAGFTPDKK